MSTPETTEERKPTTLAGWKRQAVHTVTLPSGAVADIRIPDITGLIESGAIPNDLLDAALGQVNRQPGEKMTKAEVQQEHEFRRLIVALTVVSPKLEASEVDSIPSEDKDLLIAIATRRTDMDAEGSHIAGLDKSEKFRRFRRIGEFDPLLEGV